MTSREDWQTIADAAWAALEALPPHDEPTPESERLYALWRKAERELRARLR